MTIPASHFPLSFAKGSGATFRKMRFYLIVRNSRTLVIHRFLHLRPKPGVIGILIDGQTGWKSTFISNTGQKDAHRIGHGKPHFFKNCAGAFFNSFIHTRLYWNRSHESPAFQGNRIANAIRLLVSFGFKSYGLDEISD